MGNIFFAHSGGVTSVVNTIAAAVIKKSKEINGIEKVLIGKNGILGLLNDELFDASLETDDEIAKLGNTPASAFGSCRYKLDPEDTDQFKKILSVLKKHNIKYFLYNGGNDSQDTTNKIWQMSKSLGYDIKCIGIPKTVDNDLAGTDTCPGFGSVAKYTAISIKEASLDVKSMSSTSTKVFIMEVMGRHAGWIAAASGLASIGNNDGPHLILFPEIKFDKTLFLDKVRETVKSRGYCVVVASEGLRDNENNFLSTSSNKDAFGHSQLGGVAPFLANLVTTELKMKSHWAVPDYLQRSAGHIRSAVDVAQAKALGEAAVNMAVKGESGIMVTIKRLSDKPYKWDVGATSLEKVANIEKKLPAEFITPDNMHITEKAIKYLAPLIEGEDYPDYVDGLPCYANLLNKLVKTEEKIG